MFIKVLHDMHSWAGHRHITFFSFVDIYMVFWWFFVHLLYVLFRWGLSKWNPLMEMYYYRSYEGDQKLKLKSVVCVCTCELERGPPNNAGRESEWRAQIIHTNYKKKTLVGMGYPAISFSNCIICIYLFRAKYIIEMINASNDTRCILVWFEQFST